jgi:hypothetical protein
VHARLRRLLLPLAAALATAGLAACGSSPDVATPPGLATPSSSGHHATTSTKAQPVVALRKGERFIDLAMPQAYTPKAPTATGHDDYRCFLLDPQLTKQTLVKGVDIVPGNPAVVHHVIVFKVAQGEVARARAADAKDAGPGWTCFGDRGIGQGDPGQRLNSAPWVGAWAPGGGERVLPADVGIPLDPGTQIVMQVHYNLLAGTGADTSRVRLRVTDGGGSTKSLETMLLVAPVELPCRPGHQGGLCYRSMAVQDVMARFGEKVPTADLLHLLCGPVKPGPTQTCDRTVGQPATIRAVAGHMHLLGRSISIDVNPGTPSARRILDIPVYDFDNQGSQALAKPVTVKPGDVLRVTCTHDQSIRDLNPAFAGEKERYVVWGEGTTDEMCLGVVLFTKP